MMDEQEEQVYREMAEEAAFEHSTDVTVGDLRRYRGAIGAHTHDGACGTCREQLPKCVHGYAVPTIEVCPDGCGRPLTPAETRTSISDRKAAALAEIDTIKHFGIDGVTGHAALVRLEQIIRSMP